MHAMQVYVDMNIAAITVKGDYSLPVVNQITQIPLLGGLTIPSTVSGEMSFVVHYGSGSNGVSPCPAQTQNPKT
jgi:hypothetical protein